MSKYTNFLLSYDIPDIHKLPVGVEILQHMLIWEPEYGIFYLDNQNQMCFQCTKYLPDAPIEHLYNLRPEGMWHKESEQGYWRL